MLPWKWNHVSLLCLLYLTNIICGSRVEIRLGALFHDNHEDYESALEEAVNEVSEDVIDYPNITLREYIAYSSQNPERTIVEICDGVVDNGVSVILTKSDDVTTFTLSLVGAFIGLPIIGFGNRYAVLSDKEIHPMYLRMDPPLAMQSHPILDILKRNNWNKFSIIHNDDSDSLSFLQELIEITMNNEEWQIGASIEIPQGFTTNISSYLSTLGKLNANVIILQVSMNDAIKIFEEANYLGMLEAGYAWIVTETLLAIDQDSLRSFPMGLIGINSSASSRMTQNIKDTVHIIGKAVQQMASKTPNIFEMPQNCWNPRRERRKQGELLYRYLKQVKLVKNDREVSFNENGDLNAAKYDILNLRMNGDNRKIWINVGTWSKKELKINSILWPGQTEIMPGIHDDRRKLIVVTIIEEPFMFKSDLAERKECYSGGLCLKLSKAERKTTRHDVITAFEHWRNYGKYTNSTHGENSMTSYHAYCCSGMAYDILESLARDMNFDYDLYIVADGSFGSKEHESSWDGMVGDLINQAADMAVASFSINSARSQVIDFSAPFYDTSLSIVVARRKGKASMGSFMEPLEWTMWLGIFITLHATAFFATIYEWHSPYGLTPNGRNRLRVFSFPSALTLCWSILFSHTVPTKSPKCWASRFLINLWAIFSLVFIASYTANLAAFMVIEKLPNEITGINDPKLQHSSKGFRTATVKSSSPESFLWRSYPELAQKIQKYAVHNTSDGVVKLKNRQLDAFIWDSAVLDYTISSDPKCELQLVGKRFASEGYGIGLQKNSDLTSEVSLHIYKYFSSGFLEQLHRQWYNTAGCSKQSKGLTGEITLDLSHFIGVFILLSTGIVIATFTLFLEWFVERILVPKWRKDVRKLNWLPLTQRLHRAVNVQNLIQDNTYSARGQQIPLKNIGSRLCEHRNRRDSGDVAYDISKYLTTRHDRQETKPLLNNRSHHGTVKKRPLLGLKRVNIAVQTDIDEKINYQLREVDANINMRIKNFEIDLRDMREQLAKALKEKEQLLQKLAEFEENHGSIIKSNSNSSESSTDTHNRFRCRSNTSNGEDVHVWMNSGASASLDNASECTTQNMANCNIKNDLRCDDRNTTDVGIMQTCHSANPVNFTPYNSFFKTRLGSFKSEPQT
ncbi:glutamate receptor ionotropic, NMDA 3A-like [Ptychodera flava]|uniref:glutamate receptor ionotropic, NMDA 3A-like n=1 Tax=Ptychodera flava TaxID=63121 RepID=UPI00396A91EA